MALLPSYRTTRVDLSNLICIRTTLKILLESIFMRKNRNARTFQTSDPPMYSNHYSAF